MRNLALAASSAAAISTFEKTIVMPLARLVDRKRLGLVKLLPCPCGSSSR